MVSAIYPVYTWYGLALKVLWKLSARYMFKSQVNSEFSKQPEV